MLQGSVLGKLYGYWLTSLAYSLLRSVYRAFSRAFSNHWFIRFIKREGYIQRKYKESLFSRIVDTVTGAIVGFFGFFFKRLEPYRGTSVFIRFYERFIKNSAIINFEFMLGAFICLMFVAPHQLWSNTYALLAAVGFLGLFIVMCGARARSFMKISELGLPALLFLIACGFSLFFSFDRSDSLRVLLFYVSAFLLVYVIAADITDWDRLSKLLGFIFLAVVLTSLYGIAQRFIGVEFSTSYTDPRLNRGIPGRIFSTLDNPNNFAEFLVLFTPLAAVFAATFKNKRLRVPLCLMMVFPIAALLMTYCRSGWISAMLAVMVFVYFSNKRIIPAMILVLLLAIPFLPESITQRFMTLFDSADTSNAHRIKVWTGVLQMIRDYLPTGIGLGPGSFAVAYPPYAGDLPLEGVPHSHMVYLELLVELGVLGFVSFLWYFLRQLKNTACAICAEKSRELRLALIGCAAPMVGMLFFFAAEYVWYYPRVLFAFFILMGIATAAVRISRQGKEST